MEHICLITPGHISTTPRLVRTADTLVSAGHQVTVIAGSYHNPLIELDQSILQKAKWKYIGVPLSRLDKLRLKFHSSFIQIISKLGFNLSLETRFISLFPFASLLLNQVQLSARDCRLFIGHCMPALYVAVEAGRLNNTTSGFDIEDYHPEELSTELGRIRKPVVYEALKRWLPRCSYLTAASPLIAQKCKKEFNVNPDTTLNTYPIIDAPRTIPKRSQHVRLYWFSQTIGPGRGLESFIDVMLEMKTPLELVLRGMIRDDYRAQLLNRVKSASNHQLSILAPCPPDQIVTSCAGYSFGLSLEQSSPLNRDLCLPNKIFAYLLAGTPVILSPTTAHRDLAPELGHAATVLDPHLNTSNQAARLDKMLSNPDQLRKASSTAWKLGQERYNWDMYTPHLNQKIKRMINPIS